MQITNVEVYKVGKVEQITDKFKKREIIVVNNPASKYPDHILLQAVQDNVDLLDGIQKGDRVDIDFYLNGRLHTGKDGVERCFNSLSISRVSQHQGAPASPKQPSIPDSDGEDDLF